MSHAHFGSEGKGRPAVQVLQSSVAVPAVHLREKTPAGPSAHSPTGVPACSKKRSSQSASLLYHPNPR